MTAGSVPRLSCSWEIIRLSDLYFVVTIIFTPLSAGGFSTVGTPPTTGGTRACLVGRSGCVDERAQAARVTLRPVEHAARGLEVFTLIFPTESGYASRSDFVHIRMQNCPGIVSVRSCLCPLEKYDTICGGATTVEGIAREHELPSLVDHAAAVLQWTSIRHPSTSEEVQRYLLNITEELGYRLNSPWLCPRPISRQRAALVRGRPNTIAGDPVYLAAEALGVDLVIVDEQGHWLQANTDENEKRREAFLPVDLTEDAEIVIRIVSALRDYPLPIHGVFTLSDNFFVVVARVAAALGLPTCPLPSFETAADKYLSRLLQDSPGQTARVNNIDELQMLIDHGKDFSPSFPMVVKPANGWGSECVSKVNNREDLVTAVQRAINRQRGAAVIEPFFDGPEIDVNFILLRGEILFWEISDEPPCDADARDATVEHTFSPIALTLPSSLPVEEQELAKSTLHDILVKLGFHTGVFHVEARIVHSNCEYRNVGHSVTDLALKPETQAANQKPSCHLLEINARPPAYRVTSAIRHTYGVDYFAAHILRSIGDDDRLVLAAQPFNFANATDRTKASQCWSQLLYIPAPSAGTVRSDAPCEDLKRHHLAAQIAVASDYYQKGDKVSVYTDGARTFVAHILTFSTTSRQDVLQISNEIRRSYSIEIEAE